MALPSPTIDIQVVRCTFRKILAGTHTVQLSPVLDMRGGTDDRVKPSVPQQLITRDVTHESKMIEAYRAGVPGNGKPFPDGSKMAKIHWNPIKMEKFRAATVPGTQRNVDFTVKDSKRFADGGGWGWAVFEYDAASDTFRPGTMADNPLQGNDAKCGFECQTIVKEQDYVFTGYSKR